MTKCWANSLGECDGASGEHIFSNAIFKAGCSCPTVVEGVKRVNGGKATRGADKANILCRRHNSLLSPLDEVIGQVAKFQAEANNESFNGTLLIEGEVLERWLLKTVVNVASAGWLGPAKLQPSDSIVRSIFGLAPVPQRLGLYSVDGIDTNHQPSGGVSFSPLFFLTPAGKILAGAYVTVHGMPLLASFNTDMASRLEAGDMPQLQTKFSPKGLRHLYHPGAIVMSRQRGRPVHIGLSWGGTVRYSDGTTAPFPRNAAVSAT